MKEIVVISGKGGTGKTSLTAALAYLADGEAVIADCDVDAADMHLLLSPDFSHDEDFYSGEVANIDPDLCTSCGLCMEKCRFSAIHLVNEEYSVNEIDCEGCGYCARICPVNAITMNDQLAGKFYISTTRLDNTLVHARLGAGAENSGKLVAKVKKEARVIAEKESKDYVIADGSPGIGCPVISSLSGADYVVVVTEPSVSGMHDLKRVLELVHKFDIPASCIINKHDINPGMTNEIEDFLRSSNILHLCNIPYTASFTSAITKGITIMENGEDQMLVREAWSKIKEDINSK